MHLTGWFADRKVTTKLTVLATVLVVVTLAVATTGYQISYAWDASFWGGAKAVDPTTDNRKGFLDIVAGIRTNLAAVHTQYLTGAEKAQLDSLRSSAVQKKAQQASSTAIRNMAIAVAIGVILAHADHQFRLPQRLVRPPADHEHPDRRRGRTDLGPGRRRLPGRRHGLGERADRRGRVRADGRVDP